MYDLRNVLSLTQRVVAIDGQSPATAGTVQGLLETSEGWDRYSSAPVDDQKTERMVSWATTQRGVFGDIVSRIAADGVVTPSLLPFSVAIVSSYDRNHGSQPDRCGELRGEQQEAGLERFISTAKQEYRPQPPKPTPTPTAHTSNYTGTIGEGMTLEVKVCIKQDTHTRFGPVTMWMFRTAEGNILKWWAKRGIGLPNTAIGDTIMLEFKVKGFNDYKGNHETTINWVKRIS